MSVSPGQEPSANYIHGSVYKYDITAVHDVVKRLQDAAAHNGVPSEQVRLHYDHRSHLFILTCPSSEGPLLDQLLREILSSTKPRADEEGEGPKLGIGQVERFAESIAVRFHKPDISQPEEEEVHAQSSNNAKSGASEKLASGHHIVVVTLSRKRQKVRMLRFGEVESALRKQMNRCVQLSATDTQNEWLRARLVRWDDHNENWEYAGCVSHPAASIDEHVLQAFSSAPEFKFFAADSQHHKGKQVMAQAHHPTDHSWDFVGKRPTVSQWLEGVGNTRPTTTDMPPVEPSANTPKSPDATLADPASIRNAEDDSDASDNSRPPALDIAALLGHKSATDVASSRQPGDAARLHHDDKSSDDDSEGGTQIDVARLLGKKSGPDTDHHPHITSKEETRSGKAVVKGTLQPIQQLESKNYNKLDVYGLKGHAEHAAKWEVQTQFSGLQLGSVDASDIPTEYEHGRLSTSAADSYVQMSDECVTPATYEETVLGGAEPWARTVVRPAAAITSGNLVDLARDDRSQWPSLGQKQSRPAARSARAAVKPHTVQLSAPSSFNSRMQPSSKPAQSMPVSNPLPDWSEDSDDLIDLRDPPSADETPVERLQPPTPSSPRRLHRTMQQKAGKRWRKRGKQHAIESRVEQPTETAKVARPALPQIAPVLKLMPTSTPVDTVAPDKPGPSATQFHRNLMDVIHDGPDFSRIAISFGLVLAASDAPDDVWEKSFNTDTFTDLLNTNQAQLKFLEGRMPSKQAAAAAYGMLFPHEANLDQAALNPQFLVAAKLRLNNGETLSIEILSEGCGAGSLLWPRSYTWAHLVDSAWDAQFSFCGTPSGLDSEVQQGLDAFAASISPAPEEGHMSCKASISVDHAGQALFEVLNLRYITRYTRQVNWTSDDSTNSTISVEWSTELVQDLPLDLGDGTVIGRHESVEQLKSDRRLWWQTFMTVDEDHQGIVSDSKVALLQSFLRHVADHMTALVVPQTQPVATSRKLPQPSFW